MGKSDASECNESSLSKLPSAARFINKEGRDDRVGRFTSFLLRFLSPTRGTEGVVKTIEKAWLEVELPLERETEGFEKILL